MINSSTAGGSGSIGELEFVITHYNSAGNKKRSWIMEHAIEDPITSAINFPFSLTTGLTPVAVGDYFTFNLLLIPVYLIEMLFFLYLLIILT